MELWISTVTQPTLEARTFPTAGPFWSPIKSRMGAPLSARSTKEVRLSRQAGPKGSHTSRTERRPRLIRAHLRPAARRTTRSPWRPAWRVWCNRCCDVLQWHEAAGYSAGRQWPSDPGGQQPAGGYECHSAADAGDANNLEGFAATRPEPADRSRYGARAATGPDWNPAVWSPVLKVTRSGSAGPAGGHLYRWLSGRSEVPVYRDLHLLRTVIDRRQLRPCTQSGLRSGASIFPSGCARSRWCIRVMRTMPVPLAR
jgi:hypothetical protein